MWISAFGFLYFNSYVFPCGLVPYTVTWLVYFICDDMIV